MSDIYFSEQFPSMLSSDVLTKITVQQISLQTTGSQPFWMAHVASLQQPEEKRRKLQTQESDTDDDQPKKEPTRTMPTKKKSNDDKRPTKKQRTKKRPTLKNASKEEEDHVRKRPTKKKPSNEQKEEDEDATEDETLPAVKHVQKEEETKTTDTKKNSEYRNLIAWWQTIGPRTISMVTAKPQALRGNALTIVEPGAKQPCFNLTLHYIKNVMVRTRPGLASGASYGNEALFKQFAKKPAALPVFMTKKSIATREGYETDVRETYKKLWFFFASGATGNENCCVFWKDFKLSTAGTSIVRDSMMREFWKHAANGDAHMEKFLLDAYNFEANSD